MAPEEVPTLHKHQIVKFFYYAELYFIEAKYKNQVKIKR
jgi:hypothetical protein